MSDPLPQTIRWEDHPAVDAEMKALDHIEEAMLLLLAVNAPAHDQLHVVKMEIERHVGEAIFRIARKKGE